ncbi:tetratricopeptide repeat protein [Flavobacteriaceae bacterium]|nr:ion channel protein [Flavobacteriaceae bacterium]MDA9850347.1 tetratricopeptide repeat protein [Flavobacteriaceae bacterium]MDB3937341.1 tetratricopeptide repeat protein [Flavobacteriaceae bacterium]RZO99895.1 MAG: tetratricopeptide repeat protein [Flavobacteriales bacterium]
MRHFLFFILFVNLSFSQQNDIFVVANEKYNSLDFVGAIEKYNELLKGGFHSSELYFNLGNAYYKLDSLAQSIYYYEKGLKYFPNDSSLIQNLAYLNNLTIDDIESLPEDIVSKQLNYLLNYFSFNTWSIITIITAILSCVIFLLYFLSKSSIYKRTYFTIFILSFILTSSLLFVNFKIYNVQTTIEFGIVYKDVIEVNFEPNEKSEVLFEIHEGTKVEVIENFDMDWLKIKLSNGQTGWVIKNQIKII